MTTASQIVNVPHTVADAMLGVALEEYAQMTNMTWKWQPLTYGSSRHHVHYKGKDSLVFSVYAVASERTEIVLSLRWAVDMFTPHLRKLAMLEEQSISDETLKKKIANLINPALQQAQSALEITTNAAQDLLSTFCHIIVHESANAQASIDEWVRELGILTPEPKRPGPKPNPYTQWAREQARAGRSIEQMLDEYMRQRGEDPGDAEQRRRSRDVLRRTLSRA